MKEQSKWKPQAGGKITRFRVWTYEEHLLLQANPYPKDSKITVEKWVDNLKLKINEQREESKERN